MKTNYCEKHMNLKCSYGRESKLKAGLQLTYGDLHADAIASRGGCTDFGQRGQVR
jgi:hypothetical protein